MYILKIHPQGTVIGREFKRKRLKGSPIAYFLMLLDIPFMSFKFVEKDMMLSS